MKIRVADYIAQKCYSMGLSILNTCISEDSDPSIFDKLTIPEIIKVTEIIITTMLQITKVISPTTILFNFIKFAKVTLSI